ncbi:MAG: DUF3791 domain-containing protein [Muribaculaceae bacterium]|nr:DUF3791 domain-containing protein [Muribaculaceae bacterium]
MNQDKIHRGRIILRSARIGMIVAEISELLKIPDMEALRMFYRSKTCRNFHDRSTGMYLQGDLYVVEEFMNEMNIC